MRGHVEDRLAAYCEGSLPDAEARAVAAHLAQCAECEEMRGETERGLALLGSLSAARLDEGRAESIRRALASAVAPPRTSRRRHLSLAAAAVLVIAAGGYWLHRHPRLVLEPAGETLSAFEREAVSLQRQADQGRLELEMTSGSPAVVRRWVHAETGLGTALAVERPVEDTDRYQVLGARRVTLGTARAAAVFYRIDARPAVLLTAWAGDVPDGPREWTLGGKTVRHHVDPASGVKLLSWTNSGQVYTLASRLPGHALESCFVCHADPARRRLIRGIGDGDEAPLLRDPPDVE